MKEKTTRYIREHLLFEDLGYRFVKKPLYFKLEKEGWKMPKLNNFEQMPTENIHSFNPIRYEIVHKSFL